MMVKGSWRNREIRHHVAIVDGEEKPTLLLKNATYLNVYTKQWLQAHIWIYNDRIVYVGENLPASTTDVEVVDCTNKYLVPGYVEPHAHPFQIYNPEQLAMHVGKFGTTTLVNDNLMWHFLSDKKKAFSLIEEFDTLPVSMFWWARFDSQTALRKEETIFNTKNILEWLKHPLVVQGGELTSWPSLIEGDDILLYWIQETKRLGKPVEGHFPGASAETLIKMKLFGINGDHEAMNGDEVLQRLEMGYQVGLRYSSIRPDLPKMLEEMMAGNLQAFDNLMMTTDGSTPSFYEHGMMNQCIEIAIEKGVPLIEAYRMASYNPARHLKLDEVIGSIAPGRLAHINILTEKDNPVPESVLAKGKWLLKHEEEVQLPRKIIWDKYEIEPLEITWNMTMDDLQFSVPIGLDMVNDVIIKPYIIQADITPGLLPENKQDAFLLLIDRSGKWRVNTTIRGFTNELGAIASSYSTTGDFVFIGKNKQDFLTAFEKLKEIGGGIVVVDEGDVLFQMPLELNGIMDNGEMNSLITKETQFKELLKNHGYHFKDPIFSILFLSSTHLPYIRVTQQGIIDVLKNEVLFPSTMR